MIFMTILEVKDYLHKLMGCITFEYNNYSCGVDPLGLKLFDVWYGDNIITVHSIEEVMNMKFFDGKSLTDIWGNVINIDF